MRILLLVLVLASAASPAIAQKPSARYSFGYAFAEYLEDNGGSAPLGVYFSIASEAGVGVEGEIAYHQDEEEFFGSSFTLHTVTGMGGPRFAFTTGSAQPFGHILGGFRYDYLDGEDNGSVGLEAGGGVDVEIGSKTFLRFGADFQVFFDDGEDLKVLRFTAGIVL